MSISLRLAACAALALASAPAFALHAGFTQLAVPDGANPPLDVGIWYPTDAPPHPAPVSLFTQMVAPDAPLAGGKLPLVVISHGNGGEFAGHSDTALALAEAGFVVAAPTHTGDNYRDQSRALDPAFRAAQISAVISFVVSAWKPGAVDPGRVGAFGFSSGGMTVLIAAGGDPDFRLIGPHCQAHPDFFDCRLVGQHPEQATPAGAPAPVFPHDPRIRALVVAAPALGFAFTQAGLAAVTQPVQLWRAADDTILPAPFYAEAVRQALPRPAEFHVVPSARHLDFTAPCSPALAKVAPPLCASAPGFDRVAFHQRFNAAIIGFFTRTLAAPH